MLNSYRHLPDCSIKECLLLISNSSSNKTSVPNFDLVSLIRNFPSLNSISACDLETEMSEILISHKWPRPILSGLLSVVDITCKHLSYYRCGMLFNNDLGGFMLSIIKYGLLGFSIDIISILFYPILII